MKIRRIAFLSALSCFCAAAAAQEVSDPPPPPDSPPSYDDMPTPGPGDKIFYLAPWGSATVTEETNAPFSPFLTLDQARAEVRRYKESLPPLQNIYVYVAGGLYPMTQPVTFTDEDSGSPAYPIRYVSWPVGLYKNMSDDVLFSGGVQLTGWTQVSPGIYQCTVPSSVTDLRDLWVNGQRMVRAREPNVPTCSMAYTNSLTPPCPDLGWLHVKRVEAITLFDQNHNPYPVQRVTATSANHSDPIPVPTDFSHVELNAIRFYTNPHQRAGVGRQVLGHPEQLQFDFPTTQFNGTDGLHAPEQDLGALGVFYWNNWQTLHLNGNDNPTYRTSGNAPWDLMQIAGEDDISDCATCADPFCDGPPTSGDYEVRGGGTTQVFLENDPNFIDANKEWYFDPATHILTLKLCVQPPSGDLGGAVGVVAAIAPRLLVLQGAKYLIFNNLDWGYTYQPMPTMADGVTPGYVNIQSGIQWNDANGGVTQNNIALGAIEMRGAQWCRMTACRIAHTGGTGVIIGTDAESVGGEPAF
jgi:hypothetical protein